MKKENKKNVEKENKEVIKNPKKSTNKIQNKQLIWIIVLMASVLLIIILVPFIKGNFIDKFIYAKLDFQKTKLGDLKFYSTRIPVFGNDKLIGFYSMNFRKDPRESDKIEIDVDKDLITFKKNSTVYITIDPHMNFCEDNTIALINLAGFLRDFGNKEVKSAVSDKKYAEDNNLTYATCENNPKDSVIEIASGEKNIIKKTGEGCYLMVYKDCDTLDVTEKFMLMILENYMKTVDRDDSFWDIFK